MTRDEVERLYHDGATNLEWPKADEAWPRVTLESQRKAISQLSSALGTSQLLRAYLTVQLRNERRARNTFAILALCGWVLALALLGHGGAL